MPTLPPVPICTKLPVSGEDGVSVEVACEYRRAGYPFVVPNTAICPAVSCEDVETVPILVAVVGQVLRQGKSPERHRKAVVKVVEVA